jgi:predicted ATP-dependent protease
VDSFENTSVPAPSALSVDAAKGQLQQLAPTSGEPSRFQAAVRALAATQLYRAADLSRLNFSTTAELEPIDGLIGQDRALGAINFGTRIDKAGFNLFVIGPNGGRMQEAVQAVLKEEARTRPAPSDWINVNNFTDADKPIAIELPAGRARKFAAKMHQLIDDLQSALPAVFQSEDYQSRRSAIDDTFQKKQGDAFSALRDKAAEKNIVIVRTPMGFALAPAEKGELVPPEQFHAWPEAKQTEMQEMIQALEKELEHIMHQIPQWERERRDGIRKLNRDTASYAIGQLIEETKSDFADLPSIAQHIETVRVDLIENISIFIAKEESDGADSADAKRWSPFERYEINVMVAQDGPEPGAPVVEELHPTLANLIGRIEYVSSRGVLLTNFRLIKAGAMHRANGGYLLLDVRNLLMEPFSWTALKRALRRGEIAIEDVARFLGLTSTVSLEPDPIPLKVKIVLFGDRLLYFLLVAFDPELSEYFKVIADFENDLERTPENEKLLARLVASIGRRDGLKPFDCDAVALVLEHAARLAEHAGKLSLLIDQLRDVLTEADYWANQAKHETISRADVDQALNERIHGASRIRDRSHEAIVQKVALIDTTGAHPGRSMVSVSLTWAAFHSAVRRASPVRSGPGPARSSTSNGRWSWAGLSIPKAS